MLGELQVQVDAAGLCIDKQQAACFASLSFNCNTRRSADSGVLRRP